MSFPEQQPDQLIVEQVVLTDAQKADAERAACKARARQRALDRSRRNTNPDQYRPSARQQTRADQRSERGLQPKQIANPGGARVCNADGTPLRAYCRDTLSGRYQRTRADHAADARRRSQAKQAKARQTAAQIVATHGSMILVEDCAISTWAKLWGKRIQTFSPGMVIAALAAECAATGGQLRRASTRTTALSQYCLCGQRVPKPLSQRTHDCPNCGLRADRDIVSAALAACVELRDPDDPATARVDYELARASRVGFASQQEARAQSTGTSSQRQLSAGWARAGSHAVAAAEQRNRHSAYPRTDQDPWTSRDQRNMKPYKRIRWKQ